MRSASALVDRAKRPREPPPNPLIGYVCEVRSGFVYFLLTFGPVLVLDVELDGLSNSVTFDSNCGAD
jgi:hypothetical protein